MVVVEVIVVRVARRGRRKVGGSVERGVDGWWSALLMLRANILTTWGGGVDCGQWFSKAAEGGIGYLNINFDAKPFRARCLLILGNAS